MAAFEAEVFEALHGNVVAPLASDRADAEAFAALQKQKEALSKPFTFRSREDTIDLNHLARSILAERPRLANEPLIRAVDEVSRTLRLHQTDACKLVERALELGVGVQEVPRKCAAIYYRECHFQALCIHDMAQGLAQSPPAKQSVAFCGLLGGKRFIASLFEALGVLLRDLTGERAMDQVFLAHAGIMIQLLVETLLAYYAAFRASTEESEQVLSLLPHVVMSQHAPIGQGFTVSDLDLVLREEHNDVSIKLCLVLLSMCQVQAGGDAKMDPSKLREDMQPAHLNLQDLATGPDGDLLAGALGSKIRAGNYWNEESQLGQFLCFAISGVLLEDDHALRGGYVRWHIFHFLLHEVLMSSLIVAESCTGSLILRILHELLQRALLPVGRRWTAVKKLEAQAVSMRLLAPDSLQISALQVLNRLCRLHPPACETFRDVALHCTDTFHLSTGQQMSDGFSLSNAAPSSMRSPALQGVHAAGGDFFMLGPNHQQVQQVEQRPARHDNTVLYAEILDMLATVCARGSLHNANLVCQKLLSHSNQWFNWSFLLDTLVQNARSQPREQPNPAMGSAGAVGQAAAPVVIGICHLVSGACGNRMLVVQPPIQPIAQSLQTGASAIGGVAAVENIANLLVELLVAHPEPAVKAACLGSLAHLDLGPQAARGVIASILASIPRLLFFVENPRVYDGAVAIELLACVIRHLQAIPIGRGRYALDLQPLTHVVIHQVLLKALADPSQFGSNARYWRLAALSLRWLRLVLRGPLPLSSSPALNAILVRPYADSDAQASDVAMCCSAGNATAYAFRCLLSLDSPVLARMLYLTLLQGSGLDGLADRRRSGAARPYMEQSVRIGMDVVRLLLQRDVLFCRLHSQHASERAAAGPSRAGDVCLEDGPVLPVHRLLLSEFGFTYPPPAGGGAGMSDASWLLSSNPFSSERRRPAAVDSADLNAAAAGGRRQNPSYFALISEFIGVRSNHEIRRLAMFTFFQVAVREPLRVLRLLQLEPWRLQATSIALHDRLLEPDEDDGMADANQAASSRGSSWNKRNEAQFMYEAMEMDASLDASGHLDVASFETGLPLCHSVDLIQQIAEDAVVQAADISAWARGVAAEGSGVSSLRGCASSDSACFAAGYLRGLEIPSDWLAAGTATLAAALDQQQNQLVLPPPAALALESCRKVTLRSLVLLLAGGDALSDSSAARLAQLLLGLDPDNRGPRGHVDIDQARAGNPSALDALVALLESPPSLPAWIESGAPRPSSSRALQSPGTIQPEMRQALQDHSAYEAALSILLSLLAVPSLHDVVLRYMCHAWPSRYSVLRNLLGVPWSSLMPAMRRLLLSELTLLLQVTSWEMRLIWPSGRPPQGVMDSEGLDIAGQQRLDMKLSVSEHLQEVVCSLVAPSDGGGSSTHSSTPCLVGAALRLADACDPLDSAGMQASASSLFFRNATQDQMRTASCLCLAPSEKAGGGLARVLELQDPHLFLRLSGQGSLAAQGFSGIDGALDSPSRSKALEQLGSQNENACMALFTEAACRSLSMFVSAALHHLAGRPPMPGSNARDPRAQAARAHLEALLPALAVEEVGAAAPRRLELLSGLATAFLAAMLERSEAPPLVFVRRVYQLLCGALVQPLAASREARRSLQEAMLLLLQRMLPDPALEAAEGSQTSELEPSDVQQLNRLTSMLVAAAVAEAYTLAEPSSMSQPGVSLPLLAALLSRVPRPQLGDAFLGPKLWQQLTELISGSSVQGGPAQARLLHRFQGAALASVLCQNPGPANAFFESGGLAALLRAEMLQACRLRLAPPGLHALDTIHPAALVLVLQVLVALLGVLPTHALVIQNIVNWLESNHQPLIDILQWVARLPLTMSPEPRQRQRSAVGAQPGAVVAAISARSGGAAGRTGPDAMLVLCDTAGPASMADSCVDIAALALSGRRSMAALTATNGAATVQTEDCEEAIALCYRCVTLLTELWSLLWASSQKLGGMKDMVEQKSCRQSLQALLLRLEPPLQQSLPVLLVQMAAAAPPARDETMTDSAPGASTVDGLYPSEPTRLAVCSHILRLWRNDAGTQQMKQLSTRKPASQLNSNPWSNGWQAPTPSVSSTALPGDVVSPELLSQVRVRASVLCTVFVHSCSSLLSLRLAEPSPAWLGSESQGRAELALSSGHGHQLHFDGTSSEFTHLLMIVEVSLHLLCIHLSVIAAADDLQGSPAVGGVSVTSLSGAPRPALVAQYLRLLIDFAAASGGSLALAEAKTTMAPGGAGSRPPIAAVSNLAFVSSVAAVAEKLVAQLQLQQVGL